MKSVHALAALAVLTVVACSTNGPTDQAGASRTSGPAAAPEPRPDEEARQDTDDKPAPEAGTVLGETVASLGSPSEGGLWLRTPMVAAPRPGEVVALSGGARAQVELRPSGGEPGAGSRLSIAGFRALALPVTALPELRVIAR